MSRIITLVPFVYRKFFPLGSPFRTVGAPLTVLGKHENIAPGNINEWNYLCMKASVLNDKIKPSYAALIKSC